MLIKKLLAGAIIASTVNAASGADFNLFAASDYVFPTNVLKLNGAIQLRPIDGGWYSHHGFHDPANSNYSAGICNSCVHGPEIRNWFAFDIASLSAPVTSAALSLFSYFVIPDMVNYYLYDYGGSADALINGSGGVNAFADLGSGATFGARTYRYYEDNQTHTILLNNSAIIDLNRAIAAHAPTWVIGGATTIGNLPPAIPEPSTYGLMLAGVSVVVLAARRKLANGAARERK